MKKDLTAATRQTAYIDRQRKSGIKRVTVRVPERDEARVRALADELLERFLAEKDAANTA